ncbi:MAG: hypothetical protein QM696_03030 [Steroidobacteraceae bacterium]
MTKSLVAAVAAAVALAVGSYAASPIAAAQDKPTVSRDAAKPLKAAQDAAQAKKFDESIAKAQEALALPKATAYDKYVANQMLAFAYANKRDTANLSKAMEAQLASGFVTGTEKNNILKNLASVAYQDKNYAKAVDMGRQLISAGGGDAETYTLVAQSYYLQNKYGDAAKFLGDYVANQERNGQQPKEQSLQLISDSYLKLGNNAASTATLEKLVRYYPKPIYWNNLLYSMMRADGITDKHTLHIYRLMYDTGTLKQGSDYTEMAQIAMDQGTPGEAVSVLEAGMAANVFDDKTSKDRNQRLLDAAKKAAATDKASLPKFEAEAKAAANGEADIALGRGYLSYGMNAQAEEALARGIGKGGLKNPADAQILLGVAQLRQKENANAVKSFNAVKTADANLERIAKLWALHAS